MPRYATNAATIIQERNGLLSPELIVPETLAEVVHLYGSENSFTGVLEMMGGYLPTHRQDFIFEGKGYVVASFTTNGGASSGAGLPATLTVAANTSTSENYMSGGTLSAPRVDEQVYFKDGTLGKITAVVRTVNNAHTVTIEPHLTTQVITVSAGETIALIGHHRLEGSGAPEPLAKVPLIFRGNCIIGADDMQFTGSAMTIKKQAMDLDINGQMTSLFWDQELGDLYRRTNMNVMVKHLVDNIPTNPLITEPHQLGILPNIELNGQTENYNLGALTLVDIDSMQDKLLKERAPLTLMQYESARFARGFDDVIRGTTANGGVVYAQNPNRTSLDGFAVALKFNEFLRGQYTFERKVIDVFDHVESIGSVGSKYNAAAFLVPYAKIADKNGNKTPVLNIRYKAEGPNNSRKMFLGITGGAQGMKATNTFDRSEYKYTYEQGQQSLRSNQWGIYLPS